jgi:hypothetical protein
MGQDNSAQNAARIDEASRQQRIADSTRRIDATFDSPQRQLQYDDYAKALRGYYTQDADRQKAIADRTLKFSLARGGLTGGSAAVDAGRTLRDDYTRGILDADQRTQAGVSDLRSSDQQSRLNLIQLANAGTDATSAATNAGAALRTNLAGAQQAGRANSLGDLFGNTADIYKRQQTAAALRRGQLAPLGSQYAQPRY